MDDFNERLLLEYRKHIEYFFMSIIIGSVGLAITQMREMADNIERMSVSLEVLTERLVSLDRRTLDHESRIRDLEQNRK